MKLTFLGTRANIKIRSRRHRRHSVLQIWQPGATVLIDCGADWLPILPRLQPTAILLTHAHPDHIAGLSGGAPCPVYAPPVVWATAPKLNVAAKELIPARTPAAICGFHVEAFPVVHSILAPAFGYRISSGGTHVFYVPDVVQIPGEAEALEGVALYIGDGATLTRPILRMQEGIRVGHTTIRDQLVWCGRNHVSDAIFTHCGSEIVRGDERRLGAAVRRIGRQHGVKARLAYDGMELEL